MFSSKFSNFGQLEVQALVTADIEGYVDNIRMRQITGEHASDITKILQKLVSKGALIQDGLGYLNYAILTNQIELIRHILQPNKSSFFIG